MDWHRVPSPTMVRYTIAMCNYNMADTLERSIRSINDLITDEFEILVVDDGSTDGGLEILHELEAELDRLRVVEGDNDNIGEARASAVDHTRGDYILHQLDADDEYDCCILDFVEIFRQIEAQVDFDPFLSGYHIHIGSKRLLNEVNYRSLGYNEDRDFWRRLIHHGSFIGLHHRGIANSIGYDRDLFEKACTRFEAIVTQFRSGISVRSFVRWLAKKSIQWRTNSGPRLRAIAFNLVSAPFAFALAKREGIYDVPPEIADMENVERLFNDNRMTLSGIESRYDVDIDRTKLSEEGRDVFDLEAGALSGPRFWLGEHSDIAANRG